LRKKTCGILCSDSSIFEIVLCHISLSSSILIKVKKEKYDIIQFQILSYQSKEFHKFFCAINCCSYNKRKKKFEISRKSLRNANENFRIFCDFSLAANPSPELSNHTMYVKIHFWLLNIVFIKGTVNVKRYWMKTKHFRSCSWPIFNQCQ